VPLVILRGSGDSGADPDTALRLVEDSLDRLGVCNRLNLLLVAADRWDELVPDVLAVLDKIGVRPSLPPHDHPLGLEWALQDGREATVTIAPVPAAAEAARLADSATSGLAACIVTEDAAAAAAFLGAYTGTGAFWNVSTRLLDGFKLLGVPETGINVDRVPGPRGPVTFLDLHLRQFVVTPR
jgi:glutamate-5-semialdehyde dehydrogenase